jgi:hypothetical protein
MAADFLVRHQSGRFPSDAPVFDGGAVPPVLQNLIRTGSMCMGPPLKSLVPPSLSSKAGA